MASKIKCEDSPTGAHVFTVDLEYDPTGRTINCEHCGELFDPTPRKGDHCDMCERLMTLTQTAELAPYEETTLIQGEVSICCGNLDEDGHHAQARCSDCCGPHGNAYQDSGAGYYITSPR